MAKPAVKSRGSLHADPVSPPGPVTDRHSPSNGPVVWTEGFESGPAPASRSSEYIAGVAIDDVKRIDVIRLEINDAS